MMHGAYNVKFLYLFSVWTFFTMKKQTLPSTAVFSHIYQPTWIQVLNMKISNFTAVCILFCLLMKHLSGFDSGEVSVAGFCEHGDEPSVFA